MRLIVIRFSSADPDFRGVEPWQTAVIGEDPDTSVMETSMEVNMNKQDIYLHLWPINRTVIVRLTLALYLTAPAFLAQPRIRSPAWRPASHARGGCRARLR